MNSQNNLAEQRLQAEFSTVVETLVNKVNQKAANIIDAATEGIQLAASNINSSSQTLKETAEDAWQSVQTMREIKGAFVNLQEEVKNLTEYQQDLDTKLNTFTQQTDKKIAGLIKEMELSFLQIRKTIKTMFIWLLSVNVLGFLLLLYRLR
jgi:phage-related tail protein